MVARKFVMLRVHGAGGVVVVWDSGFQIYKIDLFTTILCLIHLKLSHNLPDMFLKGPIKINLVNYALFSWYKEFGSGYHGCKYDPAPSFCASHKSSDTTSAEVMQAEHILDNRTRPGSSDRRRTFQLRSRSLFSSSLLDARKNATCVNEYGRCVVAWTCTTRSSRCKAPTRHDTPATLSAQRGTISHGHSRLILAEALDFPAEPQLEPLELQILVFSEPGARLSGLLTMDFSNKCGNCIQHGTSVGTETL
jgi:hypothetical protein